MSKLFIVFSCYAPQSKLYWYNIHGDEELAKQYFAERDLRSRDDGTLLYCSHYQYPGKCMTLNRFMKEGKPVYRPDLNEYKRLKSLANLSQSDREFKYYMDQANETVNLELPEEHKLPIRIAHDATGDSPASSEVIIKQEFTPESEPLVIDTHSVDDLDAK